MTSFINYNYIIIPLFIIFLFLYLKSSSKKEIGRNAERHAFFFLKLFTPKSSTLYFDLLLPTSPVSTTQIDILLVDKRGIFCFEVKHITGKIKGDLTSKNWTIKNKGYKHKIYNPHLQNTAHILHLQKLLKFPLSLFKSRILLYGKHKFPWSPPKNCDRIFITVLRLLFTFKETLTPQQLIQINTLISSKQIKITKSSSKAHAKFANKVSRRV
jgi:hypothetical protein